MNKISITKDQLQTALRDWEQDFRDGKTRTVTETADLSIDQVAAESAAYLWAVLSAREPA